MSRFDESLWNSVSLDNFHRAWYVSEWKGRYFGDSISKVFFVIEIPKSRCIIASLFREAHQGLQSERIVKLASVEKAPDFLVTDKQQLLTALTLAGSRFQKRASVYLDKPITLMLAISTCLQSLVELINRADYRSITSVEDINKRLESWRLDYNDRRKASQ